MKRIMLCCSAGMSTSLLVRKMKEVAAERGEEVQIDAFGASEFDEKFRDYQVVLLGPQVRYMQADLSKRRHVARSLGPARKLAVPRS